LQATQNNVTAAVRLKPQYWQSINQSIKTDSAVCRKRIRGAIWQGLGWSRQCQTVPSYVHTGKSRPTVKSLQDRQLNETEFQTAGALTVT